MGTRRGGHRSAPTAGSPPCPPSSPTSSTPTSSATTPTARRTATASDLRGPEIQASACRSVGQQRDVEVVVAAEEDGTGERVGAEAGADVVEGGIEGCPAGDGAAVERENELDGVGVVEVGDGDADEGQALGPDEGGR